MGVRTAERMTGISELMVSLQQSDALHYTAMQGRRLQQRKNSGGGTLRPQKAILISCGSGGARLGFVRARTVESRHGNSQQTVIHRELRAMMNQVVQHHSADARHTR